MTDLRLDENAPEFHLVVKRPSGRSPLAPYRFALTVAFALAVGGNKLWSGLRDSIALDDAVTRVLVAALFAWIMLGIVNRAVKPANLPSGNSLSREVSAREVSSREVSGSKE